MSTYTQDYDETTLPQLTDVGYWYSAIQPYIKNWNMMMCPSRSDTVCKDANNPFTPRCIGYGYNDGFVSDTGYGLSDTQSKDPQGNTLRAGRPLAAITAPADCVAFGDTYDNPGYSAAMDNNMSRLADGSSSKSLRHLQSFNYVFADGHAKTIHMQAGEYSGFGLVGIPASPTDALKWCSDPNIVPAPGFKRSLSTMSSAHSMVRRILAWGALCALLSGCSHTVAERNTAPNVSPSVYRQGMLQWHQQHDRRLVVPAPGQ